MHRFELNIRENAPVPTQWRTLEWQRIDTAKNRKVFMRPHIHKEAEGAQARRATYLIKTPLSMNMVIQHLEDTVPQLHEFDDFFLTWVPPLQLCELDEDFNLKRDEDSEPDQS